VLQIGSQKRFISSISVFFVAFGIQNSLPKFQENANTILLFTFQKKATYPASSSLVVKRDHGAGFLH